MDPSTPADAPASSATSGYTAAPGSFSSSALAAAVDKCVDLLNKATWTFDGTNYHHWSCQVMDILASYGLADALTDASHPYGQRLKAAIIARVGAAYYDQARKFSTAKDLWDHFTQLNKVESTARTLQLQGQLHSLKRAHDEPLPEYLARANALIASLATAGVKYSEADLVLYLINGLPDDNYSTFKQVVMVESTRSGLPSLDTLAGQLMAYDSTVNRVKPSRDPFSPGAALFTPKLKGGASGNNKLICYYCRKPGHHIRECRARLASESLKVASGNNNNGNNSRSGFHGNGGSSSASQTRRTDVVWSAHTTTESLICNIKDFYLDSGASRHITPFKEILVAPTPTSDSVIAGDGSILYAEFKGSVVLYNNSTGMRVILKDVLYIPKATANLVSTGIITRAGYAIISSGNTTSIYSDDKLVLSAGNHPSLCVPFFSSGVLISNLASDTDTVNDFNGHT